MVALDAWYESDDDQPIAVRTHDDLNTLLDRMVSDRSRVAVPPLAELSGHDPDGWVIVHIGVNTDRGFISHADANGAVISTNEIDANRQVTYDYMGHLREIPASAEIPLADVRRAAHDLLDHDGARPSFLRWQQVHGGTPTDDQGTNS